ncbi:class II aldolase/adducin family protein [Anaerococcus porci]|uniref:class II aldolase/adducin family protein n=1 Tax=Anaerococcus porci TaxID=2652269 RepID=UPI002A7562AE|nr:class II aldolase/adducin family protein [Anaerococcus porci]MDY3006331.1 class II aldolase/adducin family protein [Anaerococcus porci]
MNYRKKLVEAGKKLYNLGLVAGTSGNISIKENDDSYYITPSGLSYESMKEEDIVRIHKDGSAYKKEQKPSSEWMMHLEIYKKYPNYEAIVHTHSTVATSFAVSRVNIPLILIEMKPFLGGDIKVAPFEAAGSKELAESIIPYLKDRNSCLLANHGVVSCGKDLESAFISAEYVEDAAKIYFNSRLIGNPYIIEE